MKNPRKKLQVREIIVFEKISVIGLRRNSR